VGSGKKSLVRRCGKTIKKQYREQADTTTQKDKFEGKDDSCYWY
jgi:hypothetical protein